MDVRVAKNSDGERISELVRQAGFDIPNLDLDWTQIEPYWLVAEHEGSVIGCIQTCPGRPIGRLEMLAIDPEVTGHLKGETVRELLVSGLTTLRLSGAQLACGMVPFDMKSYKRVLKKRGAVIIADGNMLAKRLV